MDEKMVYYQYGKCPICGLTTKLSKEGCCNKCLCAIMHDQEDIENKQLENDFWGDSDFPI